jgi:hypothetical protein
MGGLSVSVAVSMTVTMTILMMLSMTMTVIIVIISLFGLDPFLVSLIIFVPSVIWCLFASPIEGFGVSLEAHTAGHMRQIVRIGMLVLVQPALSLVDGGLDLARIGDGSVGVKFLADSPSSKIPKVAIRTPMICLLQ